MFNPEVQKLNFTPRVDSNMSHSLQVNEPHSFFSDNIMMTSANGLSCFKAGLDTFPGHPTCDSDFAKGIYNLRPRGSTTAALPVVPAKFEPAEIAPQPAKPKRQRNSLKKRLLVNARERDRMRVLNNGFQALRDALPCYIADGHMAKITTLRLAINYIKALNEVLNEDTEPLIPPKPQCNPAPLQHPATSTLPCTHSRMQPIPNQSSHFKQTLPPINVITTARM